LNTILQELGNSIYEAFVLPGNYLLSKLATLVPALASNIGLAGDDRSVVLLVTLSLAVWVVLILFVRKVFGLYQNLDLVSHCSDSGKFQDAAGLWTQATDSSSLTNRWRNFASANR
jgi:hypothetical protein